MKKAFFFVSVWAVLLSNIVFAAPLVTGLTPNYGSIDGMNIVTITGSGFTGATEVDFGVKALTSGEFTVVNDATITVPSTPAVVPGVVTVTVKVGANASVANHPYDEYVYQGDWFAYIPYFNGEGPYNVLVFDTQLDALLFTIPAQNGGNDIGILPDATYAYAVNSGSNSLTIIDCATNAPIAVNPNYTIPGANFPISIAIRADGKEALICNYSSGTVSILDLTNPTSPTLINTLNVGSNPTSAIYTIDGTMAYVTDDASGTLTQIDLTSFTPSVVNLPAGSAPSWMIMAPDGVMGYVASQTVLYPITNLTGTPTVQLPIPGFDFSFPNFYPQLIINSDSTMLFATNTGDSSVQPVTLADQTLGIPIPVGPTPNGISIAPDGSIIYVSDGNDNTVDMIHPIGPPAVVTTAMPTTTQNTPTDVAITPDQAPLAFFTASPVLSSLQVDFNASSSQSPTGIITNYAWNFGDGTPIVNTAFPTITHQYAVPGTYVVTLTVTNTAGTSTFLTFTGQIVSRNGGPTAVMTLPITLPAPPLNNFMGSVKKCKFLNQTVYSLKATWTPSPIPSVVSYLIFKNGVLEATVPAAGPYIYETFLHSKNEASKFSIVTLYPNNVQSAPLNIRITNE